MSRDIDKGGRVIIGGAPQANLLPPEVGIAARGRVQRRNAILLVGLVVVIVVAAYAGGSVLALTAQVQLDAANQRTQALVAEQGKYAQVKQVTTMLTTSAAAEQVGTSTEIDWKAYLNDIQNSLPVGTLVTNVVAETATPLATFAQPAVPLQGDRIGELKFTATSTSLPDVEIWLDALAKLPGYVDASPGSITLSNEAKTYQVTITMHVNQDALLLRFDQKAKDARDKAAADKAAADKTNAQPNAGGTDSPSASGSGDTSASTATNKAGGQ